MLRTFVYLHHAHVRRMMADGADLSAKEFRAVCDPERRVGPADRRAHPLRQSFGRRITDFDLLEDRQ
jgi:hypothetical protein